MDLVQIRYFLALAKTLNFTRAAEACNVTQPALTKSIQRLEDGLGGPLLIRERSLTQLTHLGRTMLPLLQQTYDAAQRAKEHAASLKHATSSPLRVGFTPDTPTPPFMPVFSELSSRFKGFELSLADADAPGLCEGLLHGALDVAVVAGDYDLPERLNTWSLFKDEAVLMLPEGHVLMEQDEVELASLSGLQVVSRGLGCPSAVLINDAVRRGDAKPAGHHQVTATARLADMVRSGFAVATTTACWAEVAGLPRRAIAGVPSQSVKLVAVAGRPFSRAADAFVKLARARLWA